jgi:hypothetical protein
MISDRKFFEKRQKINERITLANITQYQLDFNRHLLAQFS